LKEGDQKVFRKSFTKEADMELEERTRMGRTLELRVSIPKKNQKREKNALTLDPSR